MDDRGRALRESEDRYRSVISAMAEGVVVQDAESVILACNEAAERLLGLTADQMMGRTSLDPRWRAIHEDGSPFPGDTHPVPVTLRTGKRQRDVVMGVHKPDGSLTWISINSEPLFRVGEARPYAAVCTFSDITQHKLADDKLRLATAELRESKERLDLALSAGQMGTWEWTVGGAVAASAQVREILGLPADTRIDDREAYFSYVHPDDRVEIAARVAAHVASGSTERFVNHYRVIRGDGQIRWVDSSGRVMRDPAGGTRILGTLTDVTETRALEAQLQQARQLEVIGRLAGGVAHDFNNLLTAILAAVTFAEAAHAPGLADDLQTIRTAAERGAELTRQLLAFARKQVIEMRSLDLNAIVAGLAKVLARLVGEDVELALRPAPELWPLRGDATQIEQILVNLVVNGRQAMPDGGPLSIETRNLTVTRANAAEHRDIPFGDHVVLIVRDAGEGIDTSVLPHIFEPFYTTKDAGTGLGLASSYGIAKQLGGHIRVHSERGVGTAFTVYFPRDRDQAQALDPDPARPAQRSGATILLVEDDDMLRRVIVRGLVDEGYDVLIAAGGEEALAVAAQHPGRIRVLVTDVIMPRMSGRQLAERFAAAWPQTKVLFVSGYTDEVIARHNVLEPGQQFLAKPYTIEALARRIDALLCG